MYWMFWLLLMIAIPLVAELVLWAQPAERTPFHDGE